MASRAVLTPSMMRVWNAIVDHYREEIDDCNIKYHPFSKSDIRELTSVSQTTFNTAWRRLKEMQWIGLVNQSRCSKELYVIQ